MAFHRCRTLLPWHGNHGYSETRARLLSVEKESVKHLAKYCRILSCPNSISSHLAAWKAYAIAYLFHSLQHPVAVEDLECVPGEYECGGGGGNTIPKFHSV